jgi:type II restriction enzyme
VADLSFYRQRLGADTDSDTAFSHLFGSLQTYYDAAFYVDWKKVYESVGGFSADLHLLSSLCHQSNIEDSARQLLREYPKVVRAFPLLLAWRKQNISILEDATTAQVRVWNFNPKPSLDADEIENYIQFLGESGLFDLLCNIKSVPDYAMGVEVGIDTNGRKNRSGNLAIKALEPHISAAIAALGANWQLEVEFHGERDFKWLRDRACLLTDGHERLKWDGAFHCPRTGKFVLLEVNHYGTTGSKPTAIAHEYIARERELNALGIGFVWVTDGEGWGAMHHALRYAFNELRFSQLSNWRAMVCWNTL